MDLYLRCLIDIIVERIGELDRWTDGQHEAFRKMHRGIITLDEFAVYMIGVDMYCADAEALRWRRNLRNGLTRDYPLFYALHDGKVVCQGG